MVKDDEPRSREDDAGVSTGEVDPRAADPERRRFLGNVSRTAMTVGLVGGYGGLGLIAGRYLYPARPSDRIWQYVTEVDRMDVGASQLFQAPSGESINIVRQTRGGAASDFIALSSTCPHLGCQVHWESQNDRYFCPCHNGTFDPSGAPTGGPPSLSGATRCAWRAACFSSRCRRRACWAGAAAVSSPRTKVGASASRGTIVACIAAAVSGVTRKHERARRQERWILQGPVAARCGPRAS